MQRRSAGKRFRRRTTTSKSPTQSLSRARFHTDLERLSRDAKDTAMQRLELPGDEIRWPCRYHDSMSLAKARAYDWSPCCGASRQREREIASCWTGTPAGTTCLRAMAYLDFEQPLVELESRLRELKALSDEGGRVEKELKKLEERSERLSREIYGELSVWQRVQLSRHPDRPYFLDYAERLFEDLIELHGDRAFGDDPAVVAGFARFEGRSVAVIGQQKGRTTKQKLQRNFGMAHPEGYRKACRIMELAERYQRPVVTFIDTPGAYPGLGAEERGQSEAIGHALLTLSRLTVPVVATVIGEGGSGGALGLGVANLAFMLENATYSVITPEGCASILWRDGTRAPEAADQLKLLARDVHKLGVVDDVLDEPLGGAHRDYDQVANAVRVALRKALAELGGLSPAQLKEQRYQKFRTLGQFNE